MQSALSYFITASAELREIIVTILQCDNQVLEFLKKKGTFVAENGVIINRDTNQSIYVTEYQTYPQLQVYITGFYTQHADVFKPAAVRIMRDTDIEVVKELIISALHSLKCAAYKHSQNSWVGPPTIIWEHSISN